MVEHLSIDAAPTSKHKIWQRKLMKEKIIPGHPMVSIFCGTQGSGKSTLIFNLLSKPIFYGPSYEYEGMDDEGDKKKRGKAKVINPKPYFDHVFVFIGSDDDMYDPLVEAELIEKKYIRPSSEEIREVIDQQKQNIEEADGDLSQVPRILFIYDDIIGDQKIMRSREFSETFFGERHLNSSTWLLGQYLNRIPKACRLQANWLIQFSPSAPEMEVLQDMRPHNISKEQFREMVTRATEAQEGEKKRNFFVMVKGEPTERKFRKNFDTLLVIR